MQSWQHANKQGTFELNTNDGIHRMARLTLTWLDNRVVRMQLALERTQSVVEVGWANAATTGEDFFGGGERFGHANHRGREIINWVEDRPWVIEEGHNWTYYSVPFLLSNRGYGMWLDTNRRAAFRMGSANPEAWSASVDGTAFNAVLFVGPDPMDVVSQFTALTGRPSVPRIWGLGV